jgi:hypothetical protein
MDEGSRNNDSRSEVFCNEENNVQDMICRSFPGKHRKNSAWCKALAVMICKTLRYQMEHT